MKHLRRWLFNGLAVLCLSLGLATAVLWVRSCWVSDRMYYSRPYLNSIPSTKEQPNGSSIQSIHWVAIANRGSLVVMRMTIDFNGLSLLWKPEFEYYPMEPKDSVFSDPDPLDHTNIRMAGFQVVDTVASVYSLRMSTMSLARQFKIVVPCWPLILVMGLLAWLFRRIAPRKIQPGICPTCGYDLRASQGRCPECGTAIPANAPT